MLQSTIDKLNDLRQRVLEADQLMASGAPVPQGLMPSSDELREALQELRAARTGALVEKEEKAAKTKSAPVPIDLNDLFKM